MTPAYSTGVPPIVPALARILTGPFVWLAHLLFVYAATAVACARGFGDASWLGIRTVPLALAALTAAALALTALALVRAWRDEHAPPTDPPLSDARRFAGRMTIALCALALVGIAWTCLPVLWFPVCGEPAPPRPGAAAPSGLAAGGAAAALLALARRRGGAASAAPLCLALAAAAPGLGCGGDPSPARPVRGGDAQRGRALIAAYECGACHAIPGVRGARGVVGPPLAGFAQRSFIGGRLANTPDNLVRWVIDPPALDPRTAMPALGLDEQQARDVAAYLYALD